MQAIIPACCSVLTQLHRCLKQDLHIFKSNLAKSIETSKYFLYATENNIPVYAPDYLMSFIHKQNITHVSKANKLNVKIKANFSLLPRMLKGYMHEIFNPVQAVDITRLPFCGRSYT